MNLSLHFVQDRYGHFIENGTIRPFLAIGTGPGAEAPPGVATLKDVTLNSKQRKLADFLIHGWSILRLYAVPPGTPSDRFAVLQEAFLKALHSPEFVSEAKRSGIRVAPRSGKDISRIIGEMAAAPPEIVDQYRQFLGQKK